MSLLVSSSLLCRDSAAFSRLFLHHPLFGQNTRLSADQIMEDTGCDFCWFSFYLDNHLRCRAYLGIWNMHIYTYLHKYLQAEEPHG